MGSTNFPGAIDDYGSDLIDNTDDVMAVHINNPRAAIEAIETKIGIDSSAVATSLDYLLKHTSSLDPGHKHTLADGASDVLATQTEIDRVCDGILATAAEVNTVADGILATASEVNDVADGAAARNEHKHSNITLTGGTGISTIGDLSADRTVNHTSHTGDVTGATALAIAANVVGPPELEDGITQMLGFDTHLTGIQTSATSWQERCTCYIYVPTSAQWMHMAVRMASINGSATVYVRFRLGGATSSTASTTGMSFLQLVIKKAGRMARITTYNLSFLIFNIVFS